MKIGNFLLFLLVLVVFQVYYFFITGKETVSVDPTQGAAGAEASGSQQEQLFTDSYMVEGEGGIKEWEVWAQKAHQKMGETDWQLTKVRAKFYSENVSYSVWGETGRVNDKTKTMRIEGNVKLVSSNDYIFYTDFLEYNSAERKIETDSKVSVEGPKEKRGRLYLEGDGLSVNLVNNLMVLRENVSGHKPMSDERVMSIASDTADMSGVTKSASFKNNVVIKVADMVVRGNLAKFQYKNGRLDTLVMDGGIHLSDSTKVGSSGKATVYFNEDKYVFENKSFLTQGPDELIGDKIIVFNGGKRVQVFKGKAEYHSKGDKSE